MDLKPLINLCEHFNIQYEINAKTAPYNSFRVGKEAKIIIFPHSIEVFVEILRYISSANIKYIVLGNGTNSYFCDYYDGVVVITKKLNDVKVNKNKITAMCGADLTAISKIAHDESLLGAEFLYGIPGAIGGGVYMNASAFGSSISDIVFESLVFDINEKTIKTIIYDEHLFGIKTSVFSKFHSYIVLKTSFVLSYGDKEEIWKKMNDYILKRKNTQPLDFPSAGSVFIKPKDNYASKLIDMAGLKGLRIGGAEVSKKHAGFIVNVNNASAKDINALISHIKIKVKNTYNYELKEEIIYIE